MSFYLIKGKGWKYDFILARKRYTKKYFKTNAEAREAEASRREEIKHPKLLKHLIKDLFSHF